MRSGWWETRWLCICCTRATGRSSPPSTALWWDWPSLTSSLFWPCLSGPWTRPWTFAGRLAASCAKSSALSLPWTCTPACSSSLRWAWRVITPSPQRWRCTADGQRPLGPSGRAWASGLSLSWPLCLTLSTPPALRCQMRSFAWCVSQTQAAGIHSCFWVYTSCKRSCWASSFLWS